MVQNDKFQRELSIYLFNQTANDKAGKAQLVKQVMNQLRFRTNSNTILPYLQSKTDGRSGHPLFSLNSIVNLPKTLILPLSETLLRLSFLNINVPIVDEKIKAQFSTCWNPEYAGKQPKKAIYEAVTKIRKVLEASKELSSQLEILKQAVANYENEGYLCQVDWCMEHWGTIEDIQSVTESTFQLPTAFIEFQTIHSPPIVALQQLANTFPSVLFTLLFRCAPETPWKEVQFFPFPPFGY